MLLEALSAVPDPRKARGKQYSWILLLTLVRSGLGSGERSSHGIASVPRTVPIRNGSRHATVEIGSSVYSSTRAISAQRPRQADCQ